MTRDAQLRSNTWHARCCNVTGSCSGVCWRGKRIGCRRGVICCAKIRGGRFVAGFSGEQYALPEAIGLLRETRRRPPSEQWISLSGADPLNLIGVLTPRPKLAALTDNRLVYRDGIPVATLSAGKVEFLATLDAKNQWEAEKRLVRSAARGMLSHLS
jgi:ATP-dependent helicase Lhr and Lhr-like helicase